MSTTKMLRVLLLCPLLILVLQSRAQTKTVTGTVNDEKGQPVAAASVLAKGTKTGVATDAAGAFKINLPTDVNTLVITYVGFQTQEVDITNKTTVTVALVPQSTALTDIVVIGYGTARKKDITGSIATVQAKDFNKGTITSPDQLLQNKVPGLEISQNNGQPGAATTVKIRGNNSIRGGNNPIYVVDGVILDGRTARPSVGNGIGTGTPETNPLLYINPNDIASIDVLKDASSAAIYGSRGANGVIVITTKKGSSGPTKLEVGTSFGVFAGYMKKYEVLDAGEYRSALQKYVSDSVARTLDGGQSIDPQKEITSNKLSQNYSLAFSGGNETGKFRASFFGGNTQGFIKNTSLERYLGNFGGTYKFLDKKLTIDFDLIAGHTIENIGAVSNTSGSQGHIISSLLQWNPTQPFKDAQGQFVFPANGSGNPLALTEGVSDVANVNTFLGNISASYRIIPGLDYKFLYAINHGSGYRNTNAYGWLQGYTGLSGVGNAGVSHAVLTSQTFTHTLNYIKDLTQELNLNATAGYEYWKSDYSHDNFTGSGFNTNLSQSNIIGIPYTAMMQNASTKTLYTFIDPTTELQSFFGRVILNYNDRYFLTGTIRRDGSSRFGENNRYGNFPSVAGKWLLSNESFMKGGSLFSTLAIRASWGETGNQEFPSGSSQEQFAFTAYNAAGQTNVANPDLKWETTKSWDVGVDYSLLKGRIYGAFDYYDKTTTDILFQSIAIQPAPASNYWINIPGDLKNKGWEFAIGANIIQEKDLSWDVSFNIANNKNKLTNFYAPGTKTPIVIHTGAISGQGVSGTLAQVITNDQPVNEFYLKPFRGYDSSGNQIIGSNDELYYAGDPNPHTIYGISTTLRYKKFSLSVNAGGAGGGYVIYNNTRTAFTNISGIIQGRNIDEASYNSAEKPTSAVAVSARFLENGEYFKVRNATLNYNMGNIGNYIKNLNIFVSGTNLFVLTKFTGFDPEVNDDASYQGYPSRSIEAIPYPTPRIINFGLSFSL